MSESPTNNEIPSSSHTASRSDYSVLLYTICALGIAVIVRVFVAAPYIVSGSSMEPTFYDWHYLLVDKLTYRVSEPQRGDVIVLDLPQDTSRALIKRIIGLPGETVILSGNTVEVQSSDGNHTTTLTEPYVAKQNEGGATDMRVTLGADEFFVLGDNRHVSADSRIWGKLPRADIVGRVILRLFPVGTIGIVPGQARYDASTQTHQ